MSVFKSTILILLATFLASCASLPTSGPTGKQVIKSLADARVQPQTRGQTPILAEIANTTDLPPVPASTSTKLADLTPPPTDMIGPGDILDVTIYEAGVTLFAGGGGGVSDPRTAQIGGNSGVQAQKLPPTRVDDDGNILIPYAGRLHVLGLTISEVEAMIRTSLRGLSQNPQVIVTVAEPITNTVIVGGEVTRPGRLVLRTNRESLSDVVALAGGYRGAARDLLLRVTRHGESADIYLNDLNDNPELDVRAYPGDRVMLISNPRTFSVLGAAGRIEEITFTRSRVSLAEAIAQAGGATPSAGDAAAIFVFRYVTDAQGTQVPMVYHVNMMKTGAYFLAQRFAMQDKDVLYIGNAAANQIAKATQLISQLFTPLTTVAVTAQTVQNAGN